VGAEDEGVLYVAAGVISSHVAARVTLSPTSAGAPGDDELTATKKAAAMAQPSSAPWPPRSTAFLFLSAHFHDSWKGSRAAYALLDCRLIRHITVVLMLLPLECQPTLLQPVTQQVDDIQHCFCSAEGWNRGYIAPRVRHLPRPCTN
jgi:hypothetical protein